MSEVATKRRFHPAVVFALGAFSMFLLCAAIAIVLIVQSFREAFQNAPGGKAQIAETVTLEWGDLLDTDGSYYFTGPDAYEGVHVFVKPRRRDAHPGPYEVHAVHYDALPGPITIYHDFGKIGTANTWTEAVEKFGVVRFTPGGAYIGDGLPAADGTEDDLFIPNSRMTD